MTKKKFLTILAVVSVLSLLGYYSLFGLIFCSTDDDCSFQPRCMDCGRICSHYICKFVQCSDHGTFDGPKRDGTGSMKCICHEGYTGRYCEKKIKN